MYGEIKAQYDPKKMVKIGERGSEFPTKHQPVMQLDAKQNLKRLFNILYSFSISGINRLLIETKACKQGAVWGVLRLNTK